MYQFIALAIGLVDFDCIDNYGYKAEIVRRHLHLLREAVEAATESIKVIMRLCYRLQFSSMLWNPWPSGQILKLRAELVEWVRRSYNKYTLLSESLRYFSCDCLARKILNAERKLDIDITEGLVLKMRNRLNNYMS